MTDDISDNVAPIRRIQPGELLDVVQKLRKLMTTLASTGFTLYASFEDLGDKSVESEAQKTRHTLELAANRVASLLEAVENTPHYGNIRRTVLEQRKARRKE